MAGLELQVAILWFRCRAATAIVSRHAAIAAGHGVDHRALALHIFGEQHHPQLYDSFKYFKLVEVAVNEFLLVAALDRSADAAARGPVSSAMVGGQQRAHQPPRLRRVLRGFDPSKVAPLSPRRGDGFRADVENIYLTSDGDRTSAARARLASR